MNESVEIRHLRYFLALAATENFTRAAERLRMSQPSVSQQIAQLEGILGTPLFRRLGKRVQLTEAGTRFQLDAEAILHKLDEACRAVHDVAQLVSGHVDLGVIPALHVAWVPGMLERISRDYPGVTVSVRETDSSSIETDLVGGRLDLGFGLATGSSPSIHYEVLVSEPYTLIVSHRHKFSERTAIDLKSLDRERIILLPRKFDMRRTIDEVLRRAKLRLNIAFEIDSIDAALASTAHAGTPTILPAIVLRGREALKLKAIPLVGRIQKIDFGLLWPSATAASPAALAVATSLKEAIVPNTRTLSGPSRR